jgi:hypothetical protein
VTEGGELRLDVEGETMLALERGALAAPYEEAIPQAMEG